METSSGVKGVFNSATSRHKFTCQPSSISPIKFLVKNKNSESLASYLRDLCGAHGHAQIVENEGHLQIHLFFDSQRQRDLFKQDLENDFENRGDHTLRFEDFQTQADSLHSDLYPLKLTTSQSTNLLYDTGANKLFEGQNILPETQRHLESMRNSRLDSRLPTQVPTIPNNTNALQDLVVSANENESSVSNQVNSYYDSRINSTKKGMEEVIKGLESILTSSTQLSTQLLTLSEQHEIRLVLSDLYGAMKNPDLKMSRKLFITASKLLREVVDQYLLRNMADFMEFKAEHCCGWKLFQYEYGEYHGDRSVIETKLNRLLGTQDHPIAFHFEATSLNHNEICIRLENNSDTTRFVKAVKQSDLAPFFSPLTHLVPGNESFTHENVISLNEKSWNQFTAVISKENVGSGFSLIAQLTQFHDTACRANAATVV